MSGGPPVGPLKHLPLLAPHQDALEKCVYCPKLCRASCPVSNAEPNESLIPWGKMSASYFMARGDVQPDPETAAVAWACTDCFGCRERCDHKNLVGKTLNDARAELFARGAAPEGAVRVSEKWEDLNRARAEAVARIKPKAAGSKNRLLLGCSYARKAPRESELALRSVEALLGEPVELASGCCGYPLLAAGDRPAFIRQAASLAAELAGAARVVVLDPGCHRTIVQELPRIEVRMAEPSLFVDLVASSLHRLQKRDGLEAPRYHDPCQLGRGLGRYEEPRAILQKVVGSAPLEFERSRQRADCAGGGGLLPSTRPENSAMIADARASEHQSLGGGPLVTACGSSLHRFRKSGSPARDLVEYVAMGLGVDGPTAND